MAHVNIPPSIFAAATPTFSSSSEPSTTAGAADNCKLPGLPSLQERLTPPMDWHPEISLPLSSLPLTEASFGLNSLASRQSFGERVSFASKQMAASVLEILSAKPPGPSDPPNSTVAPAAKQEETEAAAVSAAGPSMGREVSMRSMPDTVTLQPHLGSPVAGLPESLAEPPHVKPELSSPSGRLMPPSQYPLFSPLPASAFASQQQQQQQQQQAPLSAAAPSRTQSLDPSAAGGRATRSTRAHGNNLWSAETGDSGGRRSTRATSAILATPNVPPMKIELAATPQTSGSLGSGMPSSVTEPPAQSSRSARKGRAAGGGSDQPKRKSSKKDDLRSKNREAQRRFREKQKAKLDQLEEMEAQLAESRAQMERMQRDYEERLQGSGAELRRLMLEKTLLQVRETRMVDMVGNLEKARGEGVGEAERARCLDSILAEAGSMRSGREAEAAAKILARLGEYINLEDFQNGGEVAGTRSEDGKVSLEGLRMVSHSLQHGKAPHGSVVTVRDLINLPKESFLTLYTTCVKELAGLLRHCPHAQPALENINCPFVTEPELRIQALVREVRALMCCFAAVDPREGCLQQLRHAEDWQLTFSSESHLRCRSVLRAMSMTEEQEQAVKEAHRQFLNKQQAVARERAEALPYLQSAMYNSTDPSASHYLESHEAAAVVQRTMDEECENICKLSSFFVARVLTDWQAAVMYAKSHPSSVHVMGLIKMIVNEWPLDDAEAAKGARYSVAPEDGAVDMEDGFAE